MFGFFRSFKTCSRDKIAPKGDFTYFLLVGVISEL